MAQQRCGAVNIEKGGKGNKNKEKRGKPPYCTHLLHNNTDCTDCFCKMFVRHFKSDDKLVNNCNLKMERSLNKLKGLTLSY